MELMETRQCYEYMLKANRANKLFSERIPWSLSRFLIGEVL